jgi:hypothetical protein
MWIIPATPHHGRIQAANEASYMKVLRTQRGLNCSQLPCQTHSLSLGRYMSSSLLHEDNVIERNVNETSFEVKKTLKLVT